MDKKLKKEKPRTPRKISSITAKKVTALTLIKVIRDKVGSLKHGYIADNEFKALENLISSIE